jgi:phosphoglycerate dehydrogenase-like enzyme
MMPQTRVLIFLTLPPNVRDYYRNTLRERFPELQIDVVDHASKVPAAIGPADVLITFGAMTRDDAIYAAAKNLKWVQALGTGVDGVTDQPSLAKDVAVTNIRGIHGAPVSETAILGMLAVSRNLPFNVHAQEKRSWSRPVAPRLIDGKVAGIYGIGLIAEALAPRLKALGMTVIGFTSTKRNLPGFDRMHLRSELMQYIGEIDHFILLVPYAPETHHIIDARVFAAMKPTSYLINVARGGVVDEDAMIKALESGRIAGAALDVFQTEPLPPDSPLWTTKNVIITPHLGGFCDVYAERAMPTIVHNMECFLRDDMAGMINRVQ